MTIQTESAEAHKALDVTVRNTHETQEDALVLVLIDWQGYSQLVVPALRFAMASALGGAA
jgi:hypothetical protein